MSRSSLRLDGIRSPKKFWKPSTDSMRKSAACANVEFGSEACVILPSWCFSMRQHSAPIWCAPRKGCWRCQSDQSCLAWTLEDDYLRGRPASPQNDGANGAPRRHDGEMFLAYAKRCWITPLRRRDIVVMDSLRVHKDPGVWEAIESVGRPCCRSIRPTLTPMNSDDLGDAFGGAEQRICRLDLGLVDEFRRARSTFAIAATNAAPAPRGAAREPGRYRFRSVHGRRRRCGSWLPSRLAGCPETG
jgi:hypothetical protein